MVTVSKVIGRVEEKICIILSNYPITSYNVCIKTIQMSLKKADVTGVGGHCIKIRFFICIFLLKVFV